MKGIKVFDMGVEFFSGKSRPSFSSILETLDRWAADKGVKLAFVIDEVQELVKMKGYNLLPSVAYAYDNLRNISFIFASSKIGMLYRFLRLDNLPSPLYGRYIEKIELKPLSRELAMEFLREGFRDHGIEASEKFLEHAVEGLGGIIGWLSFLGLRAVSRGVDVSIINEVAEEASIALNEFCNFVKVMGTSRYVIILRAIGGEEVTWSQIKRYLEMKLGTKIYDSELSRLLKNLIDNGFIEKRGDLYLIPDPILRTASSFVKCNTGIENY